MRKILLLIGMLLIQNIAIATNSIRTSDPTYIIKPGTRIQPDTAIVVGPGYPNVAAMYMQDDGNLVIIKPNRDGTVFKWDSRTSGNPGAYLLMQDDGNLVIYSVDGRALWDTKSSGRWGAYAAFQSDANLVVYSKQAKWSSNTPQPRGSWVSVGATKVPTLYQGSSGIFSANNQFMLVLQSDGNLVLYRDSRALWATGRRGNYAVLQPDGNYVLYTSTGKAAWSTHTENKGINHELILQDDGNLVLYMDVGVWDIYREESWINKVCDAKLCKFKTKIPLF